ncbi:hypothetical protein DSM112329_01485 [Paraconexibacter sp. AEG42_29]|uniref:HTH tetR-type domain-containing protein n=1 Tax=Paraconexibacter sp. AEG42_29 TaxID=2997339 RepID=A0AAU7ASI4_9ACTN
MRSFTRTANRAGGSRREEITAQLLDAVEALLGEGHAYSELSVERLATVAGLSRSSFYRYFADKGELLLALADDVVNGLNETGRRVWSLPPGSSREDLQDAIGALLAEGREHRMVFGAIVDAQSYDPAIREHYAAIVGEAISYVSSHIETGQREGWVRDGIEPEATAEWLCTMTERGMSAVVGAAPGNRIPALAHSLAEIIWRTLYDGVRDRTP